MTSGYRRFSVVVVPKRAVRPTPPNTAALLAPNPIGAPLPAIRPASINIGRAELAAAVFRDRPREVWRRDLATRPCGQWPRSGPARLVRVSRSTAPTLRTARTRPPPDPRPPYIPASRDARGLGPLYSGR